MITSMFLCAHRHGNLIKRELAVGLCPFLSLVVRFGRSAAQNLQNGPRQLGQLGCALCSPSGGPFCVVRAFAANPPKRSSRVIDQMEMLGKELHSQKTTSSSAAQILQNGPRQLGLLGYAPCSSSGGPFWPLSSPNPSTRTSPALPTSSVSVPFSPWCSVLST